MTTPTTPRCFECKRTDLPVKPANTYQFLVATGKSIPNEMLCRPCAGLIHHDLTGNSAYILPLDLQAQWAEL